MILGIVILVIMGAVWQTNDAFAKWADNYFGNYVNCLLETGELPNISGDPADQNAICDSLYEPFSLANGRPLKPAPDFDPEEGELPAKSSAGMGGGSDSGSRSSSRSGGSSSGGGSYGQRGPPAQGGKPRYTGSTEASGAGGGRQAQGEGTRSRGFIVSGGYYGANEEKDQAAEKNRIIGEVEETPGGRKKTIVVNPLKKPERAPAADESWTLGDILKILLIVIIIIALVIVIGGQILQISKSWE